jgi:hypothetical protein
MNRLNLNKTDELINQLFDKDISPQKKEHILKELSQYPEYKSELDIYNEINSAIQNDKEILTPPVEFENAIFSQIQSISEQHFGKASTHYSKYMFLGALLLLFVFVSYFSLHNFSNNYQTDNNLNNSTNKTVTQTKQNQKQSNTQSNNSLINSNSKHIEAINNISNDTKSNSNNNEAIKSNNNKTHTNLLDNIQPKAHKISSNTDISKNSNDIKSVDRDIALTQGTTFESKSTTGNNQNTNTENNRANNLLAMSNIANSNPSNNRFTIINSLNSGLNAFQFKPSYASSKSYILIQYRGLSALSNPEKSIQSNNAFLSNYCLGIFLETFDDLYLGAEFGNETFSQIYLDQNTQIKYEQTPKVFYFGVAGKYNLTDYHFIGIYPSVQLFAGSSALGPIIRSNLLLQSNAISNQFNIFAGIEGSTVLYSNQNVWYTSKKLSIVGGLNIKF